MTQRRNAMDKEESLQELRSFEKEIKLRKADSDRLCHMVYELPNILAEHPELKQEAFNVWENIAESPKNSRYSVEDTYSSLKDVVLKDGNMVPQAVNVYLKTLASDENDYEALCLAHDTLLAIAQSNSAFAGKSAQAFNKALDAYEESITPKSKIKKLFQRLNDVNNEVDFEKQNIQKMREEAKRFLPKNTPNIAAKSYGHEA